MKSHVEPSRAPRFRQMLHTGGTSRHICQTTYMTLLSKSEASEDISLPVSRAAREFDQRLTRREQLHGFPSPSLTLPTTRRACQWGTFGSQSRGVHVDPTTQARSRHTEIFGQIVANLNGTCTAVNAQNTTNLTQLEHGCVAGNQIDLRNALSSHNLK